MVKWLGIKKVKLDTILLPKGFAGRKKEQHVLDLARSIRDSGVIALPVVRDKPRKLVAGGDRLAALMVNKTKAHEVRIVSGTDEELEALTIEENLWRRRGDDYNAMVLRLVQLKRGAIDEAIEAAPVVEPDAEEDDEQEEPRKAGRPKSSAGLAREEVARATGKTPEAIRQAEKRARAEEAKAAEPEPTERTPMRPPVDTFDLELADKVVNDRYPCVRVAQEVLSFAGRQINGVLKRLTLDAKEGSPIVKAAYARTYQSVHDAADAIRRATPESICPWCKAQLHLTPLCTGCGETGFVSGAVLEGIAPELLDRGPLAKVPDGRGGFKALAAAHPIDRHLARAAAAEAPQRKPAKGAKKITIQIEPGSEPPSDEGFGV